MSRTVRIVFRGEIVEGETESVVRNRAAQLFKASSGQIGKLFSGKPVVLRKDLPEEEGLRYRKQLEQAGMRVYIERMNAAPSFPSSAPPSRPVPAESTDFGFAPELPSSEATSDPDPVSDAGIAGPIDFGLLPLEIADPADSGAIAVPDPFSVLPDDAAPVSAPAENQVYKTRASLIFRAPDEETGVSAIPQKPASTNEAPPEEMECPKCGAKQPRRTLCWECGVDMRLILEEREREVKKKVLAEPGAALAVLQGDGEVVRKNSRVDDGDEDARRPVGSKRNSVEKEFSNNGRKPLVIAICLFLILFIVRIDYLQDGRRRATNTAWQMGRDHGFERAIKQVYGNGSRILVSFEDPNCGYCKKMHRELKRIDNVTLYTFLYPILSDDSMEKSKRIWCASSPATAWNEWMIEGRSPPGKTDCDTRAITKNLAYGSKLGVRSVPTILFANGERSVGFSSISELEKRMDRAGRN
ncbi:MAG: DsbC family protein [Betaproteobacteria bacterium]|nr:DsbC family protein [Betaproteobacteria bacterium]